MMYNFMKLRYKERKEGGRGEKVERDKFIYCSVLFCIILKFIPKPTRPISHQSRFSPYGQNHFLLLLLSLVCKNWKAVADSDPLRAYLCSLNGWTQVLLPPPPSLSLSLSHLSTHSLSYLPLT